LQHANPFVRQRYFNRASQVNWQAFAAHREQVTARLEAASANAEASGSDALCVLGAGNCNDLDLLRLTSAWPRIRLVDVDVEAMRDGVANQFLAAPSATGRHQREQIETCACDLTGALEHCYEIARTPSREAIARMRRALMQLPAVAQLKEQYPAVASTCLLSQLIDIVRDGAGAANPELPALAGLVRLQHLRTLAELTAPGGTMLLFADVVSSDTEPELLRLPDQQLAGLLDRVVQEQRYFTGMDPFQIVQILQQPPLAAYWAETPAMSPPWRWNLGPRTYLVTAIQCRRGAARPAAISG
jgi:hypothetical protein